MQLADRTLGQLRAEMVKAGVWDKTSVIVSSDHWWRASRQYDGKIDKRVPFIVKLASTHRNCVYGTRFNTVLTADLILAILHGDVVTPTPMILLRWVNENGKDLRPILGADRENDLDSTPN